MRLEIKDYGFHGKDEIEEINKLKKLMDEDHTLTLEMTRSTSLNEALCIFNVYFSHVGQNTGHEYKWHTSVRREDKYYPRLLLVHLFKEVKVEDNV